MMTRRPKIVERLRAAANLATQDAEWCVELMEEAATTITSLEARCAELERERRQLTANYDRVTRASARTADRLAALQEERNDVQPDAGRQFR